MKMYLFVLNTLKKHKERHLLKGNGFGYKVISDNECANAIVVGGMGRERNLVNDCRLTDFTPGKPLELVVTHEDGSKEMR